MRIIAMPEYTSLQLYMRNRRITQRSVAEKLGLNEKTFSQRLRFDVLTVQELQEICRVLDVPASRFLTDYSSDKMIEVSALERELVQVFREFSDEQQETVLRIVKDIKEF